VYLVAIKPSPQVLQAVPFFFPYLSTTSILMMDPRASRPGVTRERAKVTDFKANPAN